MCNQYLSPLKLWVRSPFMVRYTQYVQHYVIKFVSDLRQVEWFSLHTMVSSTNKTDRYNITEILLNVVLNIITLIHISNYVIVTMTSKGFWLYSYPWWSVLHTTHGEVCSIQPYVISGAKHHNTNPKDKQWSTKKVVFLFMIYSSHPI